MYAIPTISPKMAATWLLDSKIPKRKKMKDARGQEHHSQWRTSSTYATLNTTTQPYVVVVSEHVRPEVRHHHDQIINRKQPTEGTTSQQVGNLQATHNHWTKQLLGKQRRLVIPVRTPSSTNIARIITHSRLQKGRNDINNRSQLHASDHQQYQYPYPCWSCSRPSKTQIIRSWQHSLHITPSLTSHPGYWRWCSNHESRVSSSTSHADTWCRNSTNQTMTPLLLECPPWCSQKCCVFPHCG